MDDQNLFLLLVLTSCLGTLLSAYVASWAMSFLTFLTLVISVAAAISSFVVLCILPLNLGFHITFLGDTVLDIILFVGAVKMWPQIFENGILDV